MTIRDTFPFVNLKVVLRIQNRLSSTFTFNDIMSKEMRSYLITNFSVLAVTRLVIIKQNIILRLVHPNIQEFDTGKSIKST